MPIQTYEFNLFLAIKVVNSQINTLVNACWCISLTTAKQIIYNQDFLFYLFIFCFWN